VTLRDLVRGAIVEIRAHKTRSALTCVSLSVGVAAALYTLSQVASIRARFEEGIALAGPGRLEIGPKNGFISRGLSRGLTDEDAKAIRLRFPELYMVSPIATQYGVKFAHEAFHTDKLAVLGVTEEWRRRDWVYRLRGRFLDADDVRGAARVCVLIQPGGWHRKPYWAKYFPVTPFETYLKKRDLLDSWVTIDHHLFRVVGVLREPPRDLDPRWFHESNGEDGTVLVPISAYQHSLSPDWKSNMSGVDKIRVDSGSAATAGRYARAIDALLLYRHRQERDFEIKDYREVIGGALESLRGFLVSIAAIGIVAILAGGIGILNVTLATVFSRVREIGVRRALGATRRDIVAQFVAEAIVLGSASGAAGSAVGAAAVIWLSPSVRQVNSFSPLYALASAAIAVAVSFAFSVGPAWQASRLDPVAALRYE
jgi:putative ABC transport system permease protein